MLRSCCSAAKVRVKDDKVVCEEAIPAAAAKLFDDAMRDFDSKRFEKRKADLLLMATAFFQNHEWGKTALTNNELDELVASEASSDGSCSCQMIAAANVVRARQPR